MKLSTLTSEKLITLNSNLSTKEEVIQFLISKLYEEGRISSKEDFLDAVMYRESLTPTGIDVGLAIPHGKSQAVKMGSFAVVILNKPIDNWESVVETNKVQYVFLLAIPENDENSEQMQLLSELMTKMSHPDYIKQLYSSKTPKEFYQRLDNDVCQEEVKSFNKSIVAVTACVAGIAHTYMAAEALIKAGQELGVDVYVEKQGARGIEDSLTSEQLKNADAAILAVDVKIKNEERFAHLPTLNTRVSAPLKQGKELILQALELKEKSKKEEFQQKSSYYSFLKALKNSLMTGISHITPLLAVSGVITTLCVFFTRFFGLTELLITQGSWLYQINEIGVSILEILVIPVFSAYVAYSIADKPAMAVGFIAGLCANYINGGFLCGFFGGVIAGYIMRFLKKYVVIESVFSGVMSFVVYPVVSCLLVAITLLTLGRPLSAINTYLVNYFANLNGYCSAIVGVIIGIMVAYDLGGPVNKTAYVFCVAGIIEGVLMPYCVFASVKMVSPFAMTIATKLKKDLFNKQEREAGKSLWLSGLAGITEGVLVFMVEDPIRVKLSLCVGSAICGAIVALSHIGLAVPGAGIFSVFLLISDNHLMSIFIWMLAAIFGSMISALIFIFIRKK